MLPYVCKPYKAFTHISPCHCAIIYLKALKNLFALYSCGKLFHKKSDLYKIVL